MHYDFNTVHTHTDRPKDRQPQQKDERNSNRFISSYIIAHIVINGKIRLICYIKIKGECKYLRYNKYDAI